MTEPLDNAGLTALCRYLFSEVQTIGHRLETALLLLQQRHVFSDDEFSSLLKQVEADYKSNVRTVLAKAADAAQSAAIEKFLESFEGPKQ